MTRPFLEFGLEPFLIWVGILGSIGGTNAFGSQGSLTTGTYAGTLGAGAATAMERQAQGQNPAALGANPDFRPKNHLGLVRVGFHLDFHHPYALQELAVSEVGVSADLKRMGIALSWKEMGVEGLFQEQSFAANPSLRFGNIATRFLGQLDMGALWSLTHSAIVGEESRLELYQSYGIVWRPFLRLKMGAFSRGYPFLDPGPGRRLQNEAFQWGCTAYSGNPDLTLAKDFLQSLTLDFFKTRQGRWKSLVAWTGCPHPAWSISLGFSSPPFQFSAGIHLAWKGIKYHQSFRYHRNLGRTHLSGIAYSRLLE